MKQTKKQLFYEILRFLIVGGTATLVDYLTSLLFYAVLLPPTVVGSTISVVVSTAAGFSLGLAVNWILSITFVFKDVSDKKKSRSTTSFAVFVLIGLIGLAITEIGMYFGVKHLPEFRIFSLTHFLGAEIKWWLCKVFLTAITLVWNYVARKIFIFK